MKYFVVRKLCQGYLTEQFCIVDSCVLGINNTNRKYGCVFLVTVVTRTLHHITLYVHCQSF